jgi:exodeoxyribonuclease V
VELSYQQSEALDAIGRWQKTDQQVFRLFGPAGTGKEQPVDCLVQTPSGPRPIGSLRSGDPVFGRSGFPVPVLGVFPQGIKQAFRVTFRDGTSTEAGAEHLWRVYGGSHGRKERTLSTAQLLRAGLQFPSGDNKFYVPLANPVEYDRAVLPLSPYLLGLLLGDGTSLGHSTPTLVMPDAEEDTLRQIQLELPAGMQIRRGDYSNRCVHYRLVDPTAHNVNRLGSIFRCLGLGLKSPERFLPTLYLQGSINQRLDLLRGLMDTDGTCPNNRTSFSTHSPRLAQGVMTLVQSLGGTAILSSHDRGTRGVDIRVNVKTVQCPFLLTRKATAWHPSWKNPPSRAIISIEPSRQVEQVCISVGALDGLYLTDNFIVTHNTTLVKHIHADGLILVGAYTGRAAHVLHTRGLGDTYTIHQLIYQAKSKDQERLRTLEQELTILRTNLEGTIGAVAEQTAHAVARKQREIDEENRRLHCPSFILNPDSPVKAAKLVIIDECSMVDEQMAMDLLSFGTKVLVLGDPYQLPPVRGEGWFTDALPDFMLTEIHRQAQESPILRLATGLRQGILPPPDGQMIVPWGSIAPEQAVGFDQIIVGRNATRKTANARIRTLLGRTDSLPVHGDRLVCLRNDHKQGLLNGAIWTAEEVLDEDLNSPYIDMTIKSEFDGDYVAVSAHKHHFLNQDCQPLSPWIRREAAEFDWGYCLTCHRSQGGEWPKVLVFDESATFGADRFKWLYTAVTRAAEKVVLVIR